MVIYRDEMKTESKNVQKGEGDTSFVHIMNCENEKNLRLLSELTLQPGNSVGYHSHDCETEYYVILSGSGTVNDDGAEKTVKTGDAIITGDGASHSITNTGNVPLVFLAFIVTH